MTPAKTELVDKQNEDLLPVLTDRDLMEVEEMRKVDWDALLKHLEQQMEAYKKVRLVAIKYTREKDWVNIDGQPYLMESGAQSIAGPLGVSFTEPVGVKRNEEDKKGKYYVWEYKATAFSRTWRRQLGVLGICSSRDKFFGSTSGEFKEIEDVDERMVQFKALTNLWGNGVKRILGLRNFTWNELVEANLDIKKITRVEHKVGGKVTGAAEKAVEEALKQKGPAGKPATQPPAGQTGKPAEEKPKGQPQKQPPAGKPAEKPTTTYPKEVSDTVVEMITAISTAQSMDDLAKVWEAGKRARGVIKQSYPELYEKIVKEKDAKKEYLQKPAHTEGTASGEEGVENAEGESEEL
jgi:hypothetical protein